MGDMDAALGRIHKNIQSIHRAINIIYIEIAIFILAGTFVLGVEIGKKLCV